MQDKGNESNKDLDRWKGKAADEVLLESFHALRDPIYNMVGYLSLLKSAGLTTDQFDHFTDIALNYALHSKHIVDSVYQYISEKRKDK